jgi:serine/threonine-protein kinase
MRETLPRRVARTLLFDIGVMQVVSVVGENTQIGAYRLVRQIGAGGMGAVWLAEHAMLGRSAALKVLHPAFSARPEIVTRFFNEAKAATQIADPGIVQIFDFGHHIDGSAYIVMELLDGEPLDHRLARTGRLAVGEALRILRQVATSLGAAHARGIVHRDLKPENIFLARDGEVAGGERTKILDFGIAKLSLDHDTGVKTQTSAMMGTPTYMSPEQCRGAGAVDQRSDVYALGCVLYTLIVGEPPFVADGVGEIIAMHLREPAPRASIKAPWIPAAVDDVLARCLAKDPAERYASAAELAAEFGALLARISVAESTGNPLPPAPANALTTLSAASGVVEPRKARPLGRVLGVACAAAIVGGVVFGVIRLSASEPTTGVVATPPVAVIADAAIDIASPVELVAMDAPAPTSEERTHASIAAALTAFATWAAAHASAPCPTIAALGDPRDAWNRALVVTCDRQPADHQIGLVSLGPDGQLGTADDIESWTLPRELTTAVRGKRRKSAGKPHERPPPRITSPPARVESRPEPKPEPKPTEPTRVELDADGMPTKR